MDGFGALRTVYMDEASVLSYHDDFVQSTERHPMQDWQPNSATSVTATHTLARWRTTFRQGLHHAGG